jgi:hypothetical protein
MTKYEITLPDGQVHTITSKLDLSFAVAYLEVGATKWSYISKHSTYEAASKRRTTLWTRNIKGGVNARRNWLSAIQVVEVKKVGA